MSYEIIIKCYGKGLDDKSDAWLENLGFTFPSIFLF